MFNLTFIDRFKIKNTSEGLIEPSGLVLDGRGLWVVSDKTRRIFRITRRGKLIRRATFDISCDQLEGVIIDPTCRHLFAVQEDKNKIIKYDLASRRKVDSRRLLKMKRHKSIAPYFEDDPAELNKGLEGIAWNDDSATLFALKEGEPGLLIEFDPKLKRILSHSVLGEANGFIDPSPASKKVDYSGICYDRTRGAFWIVSDKAKRLFLYNHRLGRVMHSAALGYRRNGKYKRVKKAEGVAFDSAKGRLYVVSDEKARLYVFDVRA